MSKTVTMYHCDNCNKIIDLPDHDLKTGIPGFIIHGNIYVADPSQKGGLIGNNFEKDENGNIINVKEDVLCKKCLLNALYIKDDIVGKIPMK